MAGKHREGEHRKDDSRATERARAERREALRKVQQEGNDRAEANRQYHAQRDNTRRNRK